MDFLHSELMQGLRRRCQEDHVACLAEESAALFCRLLRDTHCRRALEVGAGYGYSSLLIAESIAGQGGSLLCLERSAERLALAELYASQAGLDNISFLLGEAPAALESLTGPFDFIFLDAAMGQYPAMLELLWPRLLPGGMLAADNVDFRAEEEAAGTLSRRHKTLRRRLQSFSAQLAQLPDAEITHYSWGEGLLLVRRKEIME